MNKRSVAKSAAVRAAIGSTKMEGLKLSGRAKSQLRSYEHGKTTIAGMRSRTLGGIKRKGSMLAAD